MSDFIFASGVGFDSMGGRVFEFDSKAMRKVSEEERLVMMIENGSADAGQFNIALRVLASASRG